MSVSLIRDVGLRWSEHKMGRYQTKSSKQVNGRKMGLVLQDESIQCALQVGIGHCSLSIAAATAHLFIFIMPS